MLMMSFVTQALSQSDTQVLANFGNVEAGVSLMPGLNETQLATDIYIHITKH